MTSRETDARGHRGDGRWPAGGPAPATLDRRSRHGGSNAWRCQSHGDAGWSGAWERVVLAGAAWGGWQRVHTPHREDVGGGPRRGGVCGPRARARGRHGFGRGRRCPRVSAGPAGMPHDAEPPESQDRALVGDMGRHHGDAPLPGGVTGTF